MQTTALHRAWRILIPLVAQALLWSALTFAFAALLRLAAPQPWDNALYFAALNWMPWAVLAPVVFWFSTRFPLERGHLWRSVPAHVIACVLCVALTLAFATYFSFPPPRTGSRGEEHGAIADRNATDRNATGSAADGVATDGAPADRTAPERTPADRPASDRNATDRDGFRRNLDPNRPEPRHGGQNLTRAQRTERLLRGDPREPFHRGPFWWVFVGTTLLRANFDAAVYLIVAIAAHALAFYRRAQERERHAIALTAGLNRAKLDALRLQLQPHFLFNTLNAISTLVHRDAGAADELIGDLSELLRLSLQTAEHEVPLARELDLLDCYLAIEQTRLGDRLRIVRDIEPAAMNAIVPTFLLQPLVENAIRHGIEPRLAPGTVTLRARRAGDRLEVSVTDDGVGLTANASRASRRGIGISNTEARLRALHGDVAQLVLDAPERGGVEVRITLPYTTTPRPDVQPIADAASARGAGDPARKPASPA